MFFPQNNRHISVIATRSHLTYQLRYIIYSSFDLQTHDLELNLALQVQLLFIVLSMLHKFEHCPIKFTRKSGSGSQIIYGQVQYKHKNRTYIEYNHNPYPTPVSLPIQKWNSKLQSSSIIPVAIMLSPGARIPPGGRI